MSERTNKEQSAAVAPNVAGMVNQQEELTPEKRVQLLSQVHAFFSEFNGVPGKLAYPWSQCLDAIALVANSLNKEIQ